LTIVLRDGWRGIHQKVDRGVEILAARPSGADKLLEQIADALNRSEDALLVGDVKVSGLSRERLAYAATLSGSARSFQPTSQTTRIARRVFGEDIRDSRIEEQLALVRMIGALHSGPAYGALLEVGDRFCVPSEPRCHACPLHEMCVTGQQRAGELHPVLFSNQD
jgi:hypothetical protein